MSKETEHSILPDEIIFPPKIKPKHLVPGLGCILYFNECYSIAQSAQQGVGIEVPKSRDKCYDAPNRWAVYQGLSMAACSLGIGVLVNLLY
jgi:hypothetical protein